MSYTLPELKNIVRLADASSHVLSTQRAQGFALEKRELRGQAVGKLKLIKWLKEL
jgi:hypothetical protein